MSPLETVLVIFLVSGAACVVVPVFVFQLLKMAAAGYFMGKYRAEAYIKKDKKSGTADQDAA